MVDDNQLTRDAFAAVLTGCPEIELLGAVDHREALSWTTEQWRQTDVLLVDAADEEAPDDQFPGVAVVRHIRAAGGEPAPVVVVVTGHFANGGLRYRMAKQGADLFFERAELRSADQLVDVVLHPESQRRGVPAARDRVQLCRLGITDSTQVEKLVAYVDEHGLARAFHAEDPQREDPRSRRWLRHRQAMAKAAGIEAKNLTGGSPQGNQKYPSLHQLGAIYRWAARVAKTRDRFPPQRPDQD